MSGHYLFWHPGEEGKIQVIQAMNHRMAMNMVVFVKDDDLAHFVFHEGKPDELSMTAAISGNTNRAQAAVDAYEKTDPKKKPIQRAQKAFYEAFGRAANTKTNWWEAKALAVIVQRWKLQSGIKDKDDDMVDDIGLDNLDSSGRIISLAGRARITRDPRRKYPRR